MEVLRTPIYRDIPKAFTYEKVKGIKELVGAYAETIKLFAHYKNYSLELVLTENDKISTIHKNIENGLYNISINGGTYRNVFANITFSYPLEWSKICIMVPAEDELPRYLYVVWPFDRYVWTLLGITVIYVAILMKYLRHPTTSFVKNLLYSLASVLYCANTNITWINLSICLQFFYGLIIIMGFVLSSYYYSFLTAYSMRPIFQPFMRTVSDLVKANVKVLIPRQILEQLRNSEYVNLSDLEPILIKMPQRDVSNYVKDFNRSFAYVVTQSDWMFAAKLQRNLIQPIYQLSDICFGKQLYTFSIQLESKFANSLDYFILLVQQSGLWTQWEEEAFVAAISLKYFLVPQDDYPVDPLDLKYFKIAWIILFTGVVVSTICIILEILIYKYKKKIKLKYNK